MWTGTDTHTHTNTHTHTHTVPEVGVALVVLGSVALLGLLLGLGGRRLRLLLLGQRLWRGGWGSWGACWTSFTASSQKPMLAFWASPQMLLGSEPQLAPEPGLTAPHTEELSEGCGEGGGRHPAVSSTRGTIPHRSRRTCFKNKEKERKKKHAHRTFPSTFT